MIRPRRTKIVTAHIIIIMGSKGDLAHAQAITKTLKALEIGCEMRVCSAHKATQRLLEILQEYEQSGPLVYITIAGRSNALSAVVDANTRYPVVACPPYSDRFGGMDILSSLRLPSGIASPTILEPEGAALLAAKILALSDTQLEQRLSAYRQRFTAELAQADEEVKQL
jgi:5-(carboxyamino)imidazole ribonucleotide mutase